MSSTQIAVNRLRQQWRQQVLANRDQRSVAARKRFVALTIIDQSDAASPYTEIDRLIVAVPYEDVFHCDAETRSNRVPLRLSGYRVSRVPHGVKWGGADNSAFFKDLMLMPQRHARGQRIDPSKAGLISLALKLDRRLTVAARHPAAPRPRLQLPRLWAGFQTSDARSLRGDGPEFEQECRDRRMTAKACFAESARKSQCLTLYPMDWVGSHLESAAAVFAELTPSSRRQVFHFSTMPDGLIGFSGASAFDFYNSRFRRLPGQVAHVQGFEQSPTEAAGKGRAKGRELVECVA